MFCYKAVKLKILIFVVSNVENKLDRILYRIKKRDLLFFFLTIDPIVNN